MTKILLILGSAVLILIVINVFKHKKSNLFLSLLVFSLLSIIVAKTLMRATNYYLILQYVIPIILSFYTVTGPALYFYTNSFFGVKLKMKQYLFHLFPLGLFLINLLPYFLSSKEEIDVFHHVLRTDISNIFKIKTLFLEIHYFVFFRILSGLIYAFWSFNYVKVQRVYFINKRAYSAKQFSWHLYLSGFIFCYLSFLMIYIVYSFINLDDKILASGNNIPHFLIINPLFTTGAVLFILVLLLSILLTPHAIFNDSFKPSMSGKSINQKLKMEVLEINPNSSKQTNGSDYGNNFELVSQKMAIYLLNKPYLEPGFNMSTITRNTNLSLNDVSKYFKLYLGLSFNDWKNEKRIEFAIELIHSGNLKNTTIEGIAHSCGFLSRSNFVNSFRKKTGLTPSNFVNKNSI